MTDGPTPYECPACGTTPVNARHADKVYPQVDGREAELLDAAKAYDGDAWVCLHCPQIIRDDEVVA